MLATAPAPDSLDDLNREFEAADIAGRFALIRERYGETAAASTSAGAQAAVMLHLISKFTPEIPVVFIDTGYHFPETYQYLEQLTGKFPIDLRVYNPAITAARQEALYGKQWEGDAAAQSRYGLINKVEPMDRALKDLKAKAWLSGVRRSQSKERKDFRFIQRQSATVKISPILDWTDDDVANYMLMYELPPHPLVEKGFVSIGDWHSTRPLEAGMTAEQTRFNGQKRECGLHLIAPDPLLFVDEHPDALGDALQDLLAGHQVGCGRRAPHRGRFLDGRHAHHEELVEVAAGDREELAALQQRLVGGGRQRQDALVEVEPAELAVEVERGIREIHDLGGVIGHSHQGNGSSPATERGVAGCRIGALSATAPVDPRPPMALNVPQFRQMERRVREEIHVSDHAPASLQMLLIDGEGEDRDEHMEVRNPFTGDRVAEVAQATEADVHRAVAEARRRVGVHPPAVRAEILEAASRRAAVGHDGGRNERLE